MITILQKFPRMYGKITVSTRIITKQNLILDGFKLHIKKQFIVLTKKARSNPKR